MIRIFNRYVPLRRIAFLGLEAPLITGTVFLAAALRLGGLDAVEVGSLLPRALLVTLLCQLCLYWFETYEAHVIRDLLDLSTRMLQALGATCIGLALIYYLAPGLALGRGIFLIDLGMLLALATSWRFLYRWAMRRRGMAQRLLVVGTGRLARRLVEELLAHPDPPFEVVGFVDEDPARVGLRVVNPGVLGTYRELPELVRRHRIDRVVVALDERRGSFPADELLRCRMEGVPVEDGATLYERVSGKVLLEHLRPSLLIFSEGFRKSRLARLLKRSIDLAVCLVLLALCWPVMLLTALAVKLDSPGPVLYRQERVGEGERTFTILKFRSMRADAEAAGPVWATEDDPRVTRVGRWIRKLRIDELPQLINVLRGEMSFVGPRPERPFFVEFLKGQVPYYFLRHSVKPGITGWAQVRYPYGSSVEDAYEKLQYDLFYIKNMSPVFDLAIVLETVRVVLFGKGAR